MKPHTLLDHLLTTASAHKSFDKFRGYFKWIVAAVITFTILSLLIMVLIIIGLFNLVLRPLLTQGTTLIDQATPGIVEQGRTLFEQRFSQEQQEINQLKEQLRDLQQQVKTTPQQE